jgi:hypothetical protein
VLKTFIALRNIVGHSGSAFRRLSVSRKHSSITALYQNHQNVYEGRRGAATILTELTGVLELVAIKSSLRLRIIVPMTGAYFVLAN